MSRRLARDDVDDAVHRVRAPQRGAGTGDDFDALDVVHEHVLHVVLDAGEQRRIDAAAVDEDQDLVGEVLHVGRAAEAARAVRIRGGVELRHLHIGREAQRLGNAEHAGAQDLLARDHVDGRRRAREALRGLRYRGDFDVRELLERHAAELAERIAVVGQELRVDGAAPRAEPPPTRTRLRRIIAPISLASTLAILMRQSADRCRRG